MFALKQFGQTHPSGKQPLNAGPIINFLKHCVNGFTENRVDKVGSNVGQRAQDETTLMQSGMWKGEIAAMHHPVTIEQ